MFLAKIRIISEHGPGFVFYPDGATQYFWKYIDDRAVRRC